eukprot:7380082-Alexandrium_andersonii.AAC.1
MRFAPRALAAGCVVAAEGCDVFLVGSVGFPVSVLALQASQSGGVNGRRVRAARGAVHVWGACVQCERQRAFVQYAVAWCCARA